MWSSCELVADVCVLCTSYTVARPFFSLVAAQQNLAVYPCGHVHSSICRNFAGTDELRVPLKPMNLSNVFWTAEETLLS